MATWVMQNFGWYSKWYCCARPSPNASIFVNRWQTCKPYQVPFYLNEHCFLKPARAGTNPHRSRKKNDTENRPPIHEHVGGNLVHARSKIFVHRFLLQGRECHVAEALIQVANRNHLRFSHGTEAEHNIND